MKIKIDGNGDLWLERAAKMKIQRYYMDAITVCGDWCPCLSEPENDEASHEILMRGCNFVHYANTADFTDERGKA